MPSQANALVLCGYGLNCDHETAYALRLAGARAARVHINALIGGQVKLDEFQILVFVGGFSWGDDHGAGVVQAVRLKTHVGEQLLAFVKRGHLIMGICNGFQTLVNLGLLPGFDGDYQDRKLALIYNDSGNFRDDWVHLKVNTASPCVFTRGLEQVEYPVRHGEGKFYADAASIERLVAGNQIALQYARADGRCADQTFPYNPNGSVKDIAGICDPTGRIFGLMPHPEAYNHWTNHPQWTRRKQQQKRQGISMTEKMTPGTRIFKNAVEFIETAM